MFFKKKHEPERGGVRSRPAMEQHELHNREGKDGAEGKIGVSGRRKAA
jgi:hypothetical protein